MNGTQRDQCFAGAAFRDHQGGSRLLPAFGNPHNGDGLCRERRSQQSFNPRRNCIAELVERRILLENALSQKRRVTAHVVVDRGQFWHGNPLAWEGVCGRERENKRKQRREKRWVMRKGYVAGRKRSARSKPGQRIDPLSAGKLIASLSTPQLSQSRNCSFWPLAITGSHPMPSMGMIARCICNSPRNQSAQSGTPGIP